MNKEVYLIRHGQSTFNVLYDLNGVDPLDYDAPLSELGIRQCAQARQEAIKLGVDLVVVSPLTRALETAIELFGGDPVPITVSSIHIENLANSCDIGRNPTVLSKAFPMLDFKHLEETWWYDGEKDERGVSVEPEQVYLLRVSEFSRWITSRPERSIAVVGHRTFFHKLTGRRLDNCEIMKWVC